MTNAEKEVWKEVWLFIQNLQDALLKVEWVRSHNGQWICTFCGGVSAMSGGDDHKDGCKFMELILVNEKSLMEWATGQEK